MLPLAGNVFAGQPFGFLHAAMIRSAVNRAGCKLKKLKDIMMEAPPAAPGTGDPDQQAEAAVNKMRRGGQQVTDLTAGGQHELELEFRLEPMDLKTFRQVRHSCVDAVLGAAGYWDDTGTVSLASSRSHDGGVEFRVLFANQVGENPGRSLPPHTSCRGTPNRQ